MRAILILLFLAVSAPCFAAPEETGQPPAEAPTQEKPAPEQKKDPNEFSCRYFTARLPSGWKAFLEPTDKNGMISALFGKENQSVTVAITITPHGGVDLKTIAEMFAQQFKAAKAPVERNGQYVFNITRNDLPGQVWVSGQDNLVMITSIAGNQKEGLAFLKNNVSSAEYRGMFPK